MNKLLRPQTVYKVTCPQCGGTGKTNKYFVCWKCRGQGMVFVEK